MHVQTDLIKSEPLSKLTGFNVWLKMENQQTSGSFKYRGISLLCKKANRLITFNVTVYSNIDIHVVIIIVLSPRTCTS